MHLSLRRVHEHLGEKDGITVEYTTIASSYQNGPARESNPDNENASDMIEKRRTTSRILCFAGGKQMPHVRIDCRGHPRNKRERTSPEEHTCIRQVFRLRKAMGMQVLRLL